MLYGDSYVHWLPQFSSSFGKAEAVHSAAQVSRQKAKGSERRRRSLCLSLYTAFFHKAEALAHCRASYQTRSQGTWVGHPCRIYSMQAAGDFSPSIVMLGRTTSSKMATSCVYVSESWVFIQKQLRSSCQLRKPLYSEALVENRASSIGQGLHRGRLSSSNAPRRAYRSI